MTRKCHNLITDHRPTNGTPMTAGTQLQNILSNQNSLPLQDDCVTRKGSDFVTHPASFAHKFLFQRVPRCNSMADLSLKIVLRTH